MKNNRSRIPSGTVFIFLYQVINLNYTHYTSLILILQAKVSFIKNSAKVKGAAVYISSLGSCLWYEKYPFYSTERALRWNNTFVYRKNFIHPAKHFKPLMGPQYDIATDTHHFQDNDNDDKNIKVKIEDCCYVELSSGSEFIRKLDE